jgi:23S rRNA pseudouridine2605 synthase
MLERLQKIIARAGIASRRHAEEFITSGLVTVNGQTVTELGSKADASRDHIKVSGKLLRPASASNLVYLILNKPPEVVSTMSDPEGRPSLRDLLHGVPERVFPVGRLEYHSTGLVLLTNDGDLANRILQSNDLRQTYQLKLKTLLTFAEIESLARATGAHITRLRGKEMPWYEVTLSEARRDALRNKLFQTGHPVDKMRRVGMGNLKLEGLESGRHREVSAAEVATLIRLLDGKETVAADRPPKRPAKPPKFAKFAKFAKSTKFTRPTRSAKSAKSARSGQFPKHKQRGAAKKFRPHSSPRQ